ncbi:class I SAM-dependent methyltransferase [Streptomyces sp. NPDC046915]|uniref:class I SAM-dependent methyltransferase n=1 Tax=Streptomyces sp. NPDC046915 TaxID=3155257 RepID=UPI0033E7608F
MDEQAVLVALWRALHLEVDAPPYVFVDEVGIRLAEPEPGWRSRPTMDPRFTASGRASIVARARFVEDLVAEQAGRGVTQYVVLGAGLDTFAQRRPPGAERIDVFEVDLPAPQAWKRRRLLDLGYGVPEWLHLVPVDFEAGEDWWENLSAAGFDRARPAVVASTGVSIYLTPEANAATLRRAAALAPGSSLAVSFMLPTALVGPEERALVELAARAGAAAGTPFLSYFTPQALLSLAEESGFRTTRHISAPHLTDRYFAGRTDGFRPLGAEELVLATT